jgi:uncharacterized repeat protein (TIGR01451 family)
MSRGFPSSLSARSRRSFTLLWAALFVLSLGLQYGSLASPPTALAVGQSVDICHGTDSQSNPYIQESPAIDSSGYLAGGHDGHVGPLWYPGIPKKPAWGDIIPAYTYAPANFSYPGLNWTTAGQAIYNNGCIPAPGLAITKGVSLTNGSGYGPSLTTTVGTTVYYRIHASNTGNVPLTGVALADSLFDLVAKGCTIPTTLAVGASFNCDYSSTAVVGTTTNTATADSAETSPVTDSATVTVAAAPGLAITKGVSLTNGSGYGPSLTTTVGTTVYYRIHVSNTGNVPLTGVALADSLFNLVAKGCTIPTTLAVGASFNCDYSSTAVVGTTTNTATADSDQQGPINDSATLTVLLTPAPDLAITKGVSLSAAGPFVASLDELLTGTTVHYRITVTNTGTVDLTSVQLVDDHYNLVTLGCTIPTGLAVGASFTCSYSATAPDGTTKNTATVSATYSATAPVGTTDTGVAFASYIATAPVGTTKNTGVAFASYIATAPVGTTKNTGVAFASYIATAPVGTTKNNVAQRVGPFQASATIAARTPSLTIAKAVAGNSNGIDPILNVPSAKIGDTLTFTLTYTLGNGPVANAVVTDVLPQGYGAPTAISNDGTGGPGTWNLTTRTITWKWPTLSASGTVSYKVVVLTGANARPQPLTNVASIVSDQTAPASASREVAIPGPVLAATATPRVTPSPTLRVAATATPRVTPPPTDASSVPEGSGTGNNLMLVLLALAAFGLVLGFVTPKPARARRRNRRS